MTDPATADVYQQLRGRIRRWLASKRGARHRWAEYVFLAPDLLHLLCRLAVDGQVPTALRARLAAAVAYFVFAFDAIPEALLGPAGYVDDVALAAWVLHSVVNGTSARIVRRHWAGDEDILVVIERILQVAERMLGRGVWARVRAVFDDRRGRRAGRSLA